MIPPVLPIEHISLHSLSDDLPMAQPDENEWAEFSTHLYSPFGVSGDNSVLEILDRSKTSLQQSLELTAAHPTAKNMFEATRHLSEFDLQTLVVGKVVDKATKGIDRMLNMQ